MLQRIQTLWLLLSAVFSFLTVKFSVYSGNRLLNGVNEFNYVTAGSSFFVLILTIAIGLIALISIFLYKNRPLQIKLCLAGLIVYLVCCVMYYLQIRHFLDGTLSLGSVFFFLVPIGYLLAIRGIYKDQKLVKSIDRLR